MLQRVTERAVDPAELVPVKPDDVGDAFPVRAAGGAERVHKVGLADAEPVHVHRPRRGQQQAQVIVPAVVQDPAHVRRRAVPLGDGAELIDPQQHGLAPSQAQPDHPVNVV